MWTDKQSKRHVVVDRVWRGSCAYLARQPITRHYFFFFFSAAARDRLTHCANVYMSLSLTCARTNASRVCRANLKTFDLYSRSTAAADAAAEEDERDVDEDIAGFFSLLPDKNRLLPEIWRDIPTLDTCAHAFGCEQLTVVLGLQCTQQVHRKSLRVRKKGRRWEGASPRRLAWLLHRRRRRITSSSSSCSLTRSSDTKCLFLSSFRLCLEEMLYYSTSSHPRTCAGSQRRRRRLR